MSEQFKVLIVADISKALKNIDEVKKDLKSIGTTNISTSNLKSTETKLGGIKELLKGIIGQLRDSSNGFSNLGSTISSATSSGVSGMESLALGVGAVTTAVGVATAAFKKMIDIAKETAKLGDQIDKNSLKIGFSNGGYQLWSAVAGEAGLDTGTFMSSAEKLLTSRNDALSGSADKLLAFLQLGISLSDISRMSGEQLFSSVIYSLQNMEDVAQKAVLSNELLGRSFYELQPLLNLTNEDTMDLVNTYKELGGVMSNELVSKSAEVQDSASRMSFAWQGLANSISSFTMPILNGLYQILTNIAVAASRTLPGILNLKNPTLTLGTIEQPIDEYKDNISTTVEDNLFNTVEDDANDATKAIKATGGAVNQLKRALMGFDELNVVADPDKNKGGGGGYFADVVQANTPVRNYGYSFTQPSGDVVNTYYPRGEDETYVPFGETDLDNTGSFGFNLKDYTNSIQRNLGNLLEEEIRDILSGVDLFSPDDELKDKGEVQTKHLTVEAKNPTKQKQSVPKTPTNPDAGSTWKKDSKDLSSYTKTVKDFNTTASTASKTVKGLGTSSTTTVNAVKGLVGTTNDVGLATKQLNLNLGNSNTALKSVSDSSKNAVSSMSGIGKSIKDANTNLKEFPNITGKVKTSTNGLNSYWDETVTTKYAVSTWEGNYGNIEKGASNALPKVKKTVENEFNAQSKWIDDNVNPKLSESTWKTKYSGVDTGASKGLNGVKSTVETALKNVNTAMDNETKDSLSETKWIGRFDSVKTGASKSLKGADAEIKASVTEMNKTLEGVAIKWTLDSSFKSTMNKCISYAQEGIRSIATGFNRLGFDVPASVKPGTTFRPNVSNNISLAHLAKGGIVDSETPFIAGEAGKEVVMPLENNTGWIDLLAQRLSEKTGGNNPTTLIMKVGETELGRATIASINNITRSTGELPLILA